jgi:hypothetical protein
MRCYLFLFLFVLACQPSVPRMAGLLARGADRLEQTLIAVEEHEGNILIDANPGKPAEVTTAPVEARWASFWNAWRVFTATQHAWVAAIERSDPAATPLEAAMITAFCTLPKALPPNVPRAFLVLDGVLCVP